MKSVEEADVSGKRVIVRCDFDVPVENGRILDDTRIKDSLPTLKYLLSNGAKLFYKQANAGSRGIRFVKRTAMK